MSDTSVQTAPTPTSASPVMGERPTTATPPQPWTPQRILKSLASLRLTVVLFVLSLLLVFFGTMAQIDNGIGTVMKQYFRWWYVWVPWKLLLQFAQVFFGVSPKLTVTGGFPFPGGWTLGLLLLVNLIAAHLIRFKLSWKRSGILLTHFGLIVLMLGELATGLFAVEARMPIGEGETAVFTDVSDSLELAILTPDRKDASKDVVVVIPDRLVRSVGKRIANEQLPFDVEVIEFWRNSNLVEHARKGQEMPNKRRASDGRDYGVSIEAEGSGVDTEAKSDMPAARIAFYKKGTDEKIKELFFSFWYYPNAVNRILDFPPQTVSADGTDYEVELRPRREYKDYSITLKQFAHEKFPGTDKPRNFQSTIDFTGVDGERREVKIYMNNPLRYRGETFYQSGYFPDNTGTILQVVRNPAWLMPYLSCTLVTLGLLIHFGLTLATFLSRRTPS